MEDFLYVLKMELDGKLTQEQIAYQLDLYRNYIIEEMGKNMVNLLTFKRLEGIESP